MSIAIQIQHEVPVETRLVTIRIPAAIKKERDAKVGKRVCLVCEEKIKTASRRGLCPACRAFVRRVIASGQKTEEQLIRSGKLLESRGAFNSTGNPKRMALLDD